MEKFCSRFKCVYVCIDHILSGHDPCGLTNSGNGCTCASSWTRPRPLLPHSLGTRLHVKIQFSGAYHRNNQRAGPTHQIKSLCCSFAGGSSLELCPCKEAECFLLRLLSPLDISPEQDTQHQTLYRSTQVPHLLLWSPISDGSAVYKVVRRILPQ